MKTTTAASLLLVATLPAQAATLDFKVFIQIQRGMSEAHVLYLAGKPDLTSVQSPLWGGRRTWHYIPADSDSEKWITTLHFNEMGILTRLDREKVIR
jgi:outer membrane protein assembly factor BamE (lipoprotein component of BamABCDE complex)